MEASVWQARWRKTSVSVPVPAKATLSSTETVLLVSLGSLQGIPIPKAVRDLVPKVGESPLKLQVRATPYDACTACFFGRTTRVASCAVTQQQLSDDLLSVSTPLSSRSQFLLRTRVRDRRCVVALEFALCVPSKEWQCSLGFSLLSVFDQQHKLQTLSQSGQQLYQQQLHQQQVLHDQQYLQQSAKTEEDESSQTAAVYGGSVRAPLAIETDQLESLDLDGVTDLLTAKTLPDSAVRYAVYRASRRQAAWSQQFPANSPVALHEEESSRGGSLMHQMSTYHVDLRQLRLCVTLGALNSACAALRKANQQNTSSRGEHLSVSPQLSLRFAAHNGRTALSQPVRVHLLLEESAASPNKPVSSEEDTVVSSNDSSESTSPDKTERSLEKVTFCFDGRSSLSFVAPFRFVSQREVALAFDLFVALPTEQDPKQSVSAPVASGFMLLDSELSPSVGSTEARLELRSSLAWPRCLLGPESPLLGRENGDVCAVLQFRSRLLCAETRQRRLQDELPASASAVAADTGGHSDREEEDTERKQLEHLYMEMEQESELESESMQELSNESVHMSAESEEEVDTTKGDMEVAPSPVPTSTAPVQQQQQGDLRTESSLRLSPSELAHLVAQTKARALSALTSVQVQALRLDGDFCDDDAKAVLLRGVVVSLEGLFEQSPCLEFSLRAQSVQSQSSQLGQSCLVRLQSDSRSGGSKGIAGACADLDVDSVQLPSFLRWSNEAQIRVALSDSYSRLEFAQGSLDASLFCSMVRTVLTGHRSDQAFEVTREVTLPLSSALFSEGALPIGELLLSVRLSAWATSPTTGTDPLAGSKADGESLLAGTVMPSHLDSERSFNFVDTLEQKQETATAAVTPAFQRSFEAIRVDLTEQQQQQRQAPPATSTSFSTMRQLQQSNALSAEKAQLLATLASSGGNTQSFVVLSPQQCRLGSTAFVCLVFRNPFDSGTSMQSFGIDVQDDEHGEVSVVTDRSEFDAVFLVQQQLPPTFTRCFRPGEFSLRAHQVVTFLLRVDMRTCQGPTDGGSIYVRSVQHSQVRHRVVVRHAESANAWYSEQAPKESGAGHTRDLFCFAVERSLGSFERVPVHRVQHLSLERRSRVRSSLALPGDLHAVSAWCSHEHIDAAVISRDEETQLELCTTVGAQFASSALVFVYADAFQLRPCLVLRLCLRVHEEGDLVDASPAAGSLAASTFLPLSHALRRLRRLLPSQDTARLHLRLPLLPSTEAQSRNCISILNLNPPRSNSSRTLCFGLGWFLSAGPKLHAEGRHARVAHEARLGTPFGTSRTPAVSAQFLLQLIDLALQRRDLQSLE
ncbi:MAG: hypothetical protein MHM6MM_003368 [Cercozoa sp. M6MM]